MYCSPMISIPAYESARPLFKHHSEDQLSSCLFVQANDGIVTLIRP